MDGQRDRWMDDRGMDDDRGTVGWIDGWMDRGADRQTGQMDG